MSFAKFLLNTLRASTLALAIMWSQSFAQLAPDWEREFYLRADEDEECLQVLMDEGGCHFYHLGKYRDGLVVQKRDLNGELVFSRYINQPNSYYRDARIQPQLNGNIEVFMTDDSPTAGEEVFRTMLDSTGFRLRDVFFTSLTTNLRGPYLRQWVNSTEYVEVVNDDLAGSVGSTLNYYSELGGLIWSRTINPPLDNITTGLLIDPVSKDYFLGGTGHSASNGSHVMLLKYSPGGSPIWAKTYDLHACDCSDTLVDMLQDPSGNIYMLANSQDSAGNGKIVTLKYSPSGGLLWTDVYDNPDVDKEKGVKLIEMDGSVYWIGTSELWLWKVHAVSRRIREDGTHMWTRTDTAVSSVGVVTPRDIAGRLNKEVIFAGSWTRTGATTDGFAMCVDTAGAQVWRSTYTTGLTGQDFASSVAVAPSGRIVVGATVQTVSNSYDNMVYGHDDTSSVKFQNSFLELDESNPMPVASTYDSGNNLITLAYIENYLGATSSNDQLLLKYSPGGNLLWQHGFGYPSSLESPAALCTDSVGNIFAVGTSHNLTSGVKTGYLCKVSPSGALQWQAVFPSADFPYPMPQQVMIGDSGNIYISVIDASKPFIVKYNASGIFKWAKQVGDPFVNIFHLMELGSDEQIYCAVDSFGFKGIKKFNSNGDQLWFSKTPDDILGLSHFALDKDDNVLVVCHYAPFPSNYTTVYKYNSAGGLVFSKIEYLTKSGAYCTFDQSGYAYTVENAGIYKSVIRKYSPTGTEIWKIDSYPYNPNTPAEWRGNQFADDGNGNIYLMGPNYVWQTDSAGNVSPDVGLYYHCEYVDESFGHFALSPDGHVATFGNFSDFTTPYPNVVGLVAVQWNTCTTMPVSSGFSFTTSGVEVTFTSSASPALDHHWDFGDGTFSTAINPVHTYPATGTYTACLTTSTFCKNAEHCEPLSVVGVPTPERESFVIYPNPGAGNFVVEWPFDLEGRWMDLEVIDQWGSIVKSVEVQEGNRITLDLSGYASGIYTVRLFDPSGLPMAKRLVLLK